MNLYWIFHEEGWIGFEGIGAARRSELNFKLVPGCHEAGMGDVQFEYLVRAAQNSIAQGYW